MTSTVYPVGGGMEDWGYAAGWDYTTDATILECQTQSAPDLSPDFFTKHTITGIRAPVFLIEAAFDKDPPATTFGGRRIRKNLGKLDGDFHVTR